ncbi:hypothetical protein BHE74_00024578, partial [Ensete ventricosum]
ETFIKSSIPYSHRVRALSCKNDKGEGTGRSDGIDPSCFFLFFLSAARFPTRLRFPLKKTSSDLPRHSYDPKAPGTLRVPSKNPQMLLPEAIGARIREAFLEPQSGHDEEGAG